MRSRLFRREQGYTMIELMMVIGILGVITPALLLFFQNYTQSMAADEMRSQLQSLNQNTFLRLHERLGMCRHMFQGSAAGGISMISNLQFSATAPATVTGSAMAVLQSNSSQSFANAVINSNLIGNELLFATYDSPQNIGNQRYNAPLTTTGGAGGVIVTDSAGVTVPMVVDVYRFWFYYLAANPTNRGPKDFKTYRLVEWESTQMADAAEINNMPDTVLAGNVIKWLVAGGDANTNTTYSIRLAWDPHQNSDANAFYSLNTNGTLTALAATQPVTEATWQYITRVNQGILSGGFRYGIMGNTWSGATPPALGTKNVVPILATPNGLFPGGFEVGLSGNDQGREVLFRSMLVAEGATKLPVYNDETSVVNFFDVW